MLDRKLFKNLDYLFLVVTLAVLAMSSVMVYSASANLIPGDPYYYFRKHLIGIAVGLVGMIGVISVNYTRFSRNIWYTYGFNLLMLLIVLMIGYEVKGAQSWIGLGILNLQPSELAKVLMIVSFAQFLVSRQGKLDGVKDLLPCFLFFVPPLLLILAQPDLGTSLVFIAVMFGMLFIGGGRPWLVLGIFVAGLLGTIGIILAHFRLGLRLPLEEYQIMRLVVFLNPYNDGEGGRGWGYNVIQSQVAVGSGGLWGKGLTQGSQVQLNFLPEHHTDFIFSVVGEELGFVGAAVLLLLYVILIYRGLRIAAEAKDLFGTLLVVGTTSMIMFHLLVNVGMTIGMMPVTGIPLPLFSYGGSSMVANLLAIGLVLNVNLRRQKILF